MVRQHRMGAGRNHLFGSVLFQRSGGMAQGAGGVHDVVNQDAGSALHLADDVHHLALVRARAALINDRQFRIQLLGERPRARYAADIRRHHQRFGQLATPEFGGQHRGGINVIGGDIKKAFYLVGMQVHRQHPGGACLADHGGHQLGRDGDPLIARAAILPRITEVGNHCGNTLHRGAFQCVNQHQQFDQVVVTRRAGGLHDEHVQRAHVLHHLHIHLAIAEAIDRSLAHRQAEAVHDFVCQFRIGVAGEQAEIIQRHDREIGRSGRGLWRSGFGVNGWGGRIRTSEYRVQSPAP